MRTGQARKRSKYGAVKTTVDGITFHSKREAARYRELALLVKAGEISQLLLQPRYGLWIKPFVREDVVPGELLLAGQYVGDFQYVTKAGEKVVEDVKGMKTPVYRLKKRIMEALYGFVIRET